jgi:hypothetical protein
MNAMARVPVTPCYLVLKTESFASLITVDGFRHDSQSASLRSDFIHIAHITILDSRPGFDFLERGRGQLKGFGLNTRAGTESHAFRNSVRSPSRETGS